MIPNDPAILLSFVNTKLRDFYSNLDDMCDDMELERKNINSLVKIPIFAVFCLSLNGNYLKASLFHSFP